MLINYTTGIPTAVKRRLMLTLAVLSLSAGPGWCQTLKGHVTDEKERPLNHVHIQLLRDGKQRYRCYTNKKGNYQVWPVDPGYYQALVTVEGYDRLVRDINLKRTDSSIINFSLHKKPGLLAR